MIITDTQCSDSSKWLGVVMQQIITWINVDKDSWCNVASLGHDVLTHWGRVTHICVSKLTIIGSDNGLSPRRRQAIIWTNAAMLLIGPLGTNFSEILIEILTFSFKKMCLKVSSAKWRPFCLGLNVLIGQLRGFYGVYVALCYFRRNIDKSNIDKFRLYHT